MEIFPPVNKLVTTPVLPITPDILQEKMTVNMCSFLTLMFTVGWLAVCLDSLVHLLLQGPQGSTRVYLGLPGAGHTGYDRSVLLAAINATSLTLWFPYIIGFYCEILPNRRVCVSLRHQILCHLSVCQLSLVNMCVKYDTCRSEMRLRMEQMRSLSD